jgi:hypothetical protein
MRTELIYSVGQEERLLPIPTTAVRATRGCDEPLSFWSVQRRSLLSETSLKTGDLALRPAQE